MALRAPRRLPRHFNRETGAFSRALAQKRYATPRRRARKRHELLLRFTRRFSRVRSMLASEFRAWMLIGSGTIVVSMMLALLFAPFFDVRQITIRRQDPRIDLDEIQQTLSPLFRQRLLLVTKGQVAAMLQTEYPDINSVNIVKEYPSTLIVSIAVEPVVAAVVIDDNESLPESQSGAFVGSGAYAYITRTGTFVSSPVKLLSSVPIPTLRLTDWGIRPQNRTKALSGDFIEQIFAARDILRTDFGLSVRDIVVYVRAKEFHIRTAKVTLWFDLRGPLSVQFRRFREFLRTVSLDQVKSYVDLRIVDKIIYQ